MTLDDFEIINSMLPVKGQIILDSKLSTEFKRDMFIVVEQLLEKVHGFQVDPDRALSNNFVLFNSIIWVGIFPNKRALMWMGLPDYKREDLKCCLITDFLKIKKDSPNRSMFYSCLFNL